MFCEKCGAQIADNAMFCNSCGGKVEAAPEEVMQNAETVTEGGAAVITETPAAETAAPANDYIVSDFNMNATKPKKNISKKLVAGIVGASVLTVGAFGLFLKDTIFFAVSPEKYTGNLISNTFENMSKEAEEIDKNLLGFVLSSDDAFTVGTNIQVSEEYEQGMSMEMDYQVANDPGNSEMLINADVKGSQDGQNITGNIQGFWNDEKIGIAISDVTANGEGVLPKDVTDKYFVVSSKNFGDDFMDSMFAGMLNLGLAYTDNDTVDISGLDLSYTNVMNLLTGEDLKPLMKEVKKEFVLLLEESDISDRKKVTYRFDDDKVNAKRITVTVEAKDLVDFGIGVLEAAQNDEFMQEQLGDEILMYLDLGIDGLKQARSSVPDYEFDVEFIEYDGRIVEMTLVIEGNGVIISSTDKDHLLNGIRFEMVQDGNTQGAVELTSNWVSEDKEIFLEASISENGSVMGKAEVNFDFDKEKFDASVSVPGVESYGIGGTCSKKDGFTLTIDDIRVPQSGQVKTNSMEYDEWFDEEYRNAEDKNYSYYNENENYDDLWDIYYDDYWYDYDSYADWYDAMGRNYDENYKTYDEWLNDEIYNSEENKEDYDYETADYEYVDYDMVIKITFTVKEGANVQVEDRKHIDIFKMTEEDINDLEESFEESNVTDVITG